MDTIDIYIYSFIGVILTGLGVLFFFLELKFKHKVIIRELSNERKIITIHKAKEIINEQGIKYWQITKVDKKIRLVSAPPEAAVEITNKGRKIAECYRTQTDDLIWIIDKNKVINPPDDLYNNPPLDITAMTDEYLRDKELKEWEKNMWKGWVLENNVIQAFQPFTTNQRSIYVNNLKKAESRKGESTMDKILKLVYPAVILIAIAILVFGYGEIAQPVITANSQMIEMKQIDAQMLVLLKEIELKVQSIKQDGTVPTTQTARPD